MQAQAPPAKALTISPEYLSPPSAITGTPCFLPSSAQSITAVNWGTPTPATILVVQIDPGPIPTLIQSAPASAKSLVASAVATLPAIIWSSGYLAFIFLTPSITPFECPWAVSNVITSTWALTKASTLSIISLVIPTDAPQRSLPFESFAAFGYALTFSISFIVISPFKLLSLSTKGNFSILWVFNISKASSKVVPSGAVTNGLLVITSETILS